MGDKQRFQFSQAFTDFYFNANIEKLDGLAEGRRMFIVIDQKVAEHHSAFVDRFDCIILPSGEHHKVQATVDAIVLKLLERGADRRSLLVGVGGGVVTDLTGYVAAIYMRGISFGFVPTTLLAMVDAAIGGKNGIDVGMYKNMVGTIRQPEFILYDYRVLASLSLADWQNGFAEIIKHASIKDNKMFALLEQRAVEHYRRNHEDLATLVRDNALIKIMTVQADEFEKGDRKLLNFGHTLGHAIENEYQLSHGQAIAIGMNFASALSERKTPFGERLRVKKLLEHYGLPTEMVFDKEMVLSIMKRDKKSEGAFINFVLLDHIGKASVYPITFDEIFENI